MNPNGSNGTPESIPMNSRQFTPVYLIQKSSISEARSYVLTPTVSEEPKPVTNNLKLFYENSGNIENSVLLSNVQYVSNSTASTKPIQEQPLGNNLKLASFLVPKKDANKQQYYAAITNKILKPNVGSTNTNILPDISIANTKPNGARSNVNAPRTLLKPRILPKIKPKEKILEAPNHTSVHLLKLDGTYHSLNQLNDQQMRIVNQALDNIQQQNPERAKLKPTYDPVSNTRIVYKVISPNDLKVVGKNKIIIQQQNEDIKSDIKELESAEETAEPVAEVNKIQVTRSGRTVKLPKSRIQDTQEEVPPKAKKKVNILVSCFKCSAEFNSIYKLKRHYEKQPAHAPPEVHTSLFRCLLAMVRNGADADKTSLFITQLEQLVEKLKALLPCLLKKMDGAEGTPADINDDIGRLFGLSPGKYSLNMDALNCVKDKHGYCKHNPRKQMQVKSELSKPSQVWLSKHQEETANVGISPLPMPSEGDGEHCARIQPVDKWPIKRDWKSRSDEAENETQNHKKIKITCDTGEPLIELGSETFENVAEFSTTKQMVSISHDDKAVDPNDTPLKETNGLKTISNKKNNVSHDQFYSTHFDIRLSPIKLSTRVFNKFQINPEKTPLELDEQLLRPLTFDDESDHNIHNQEKSLQTNCENSLDLKGIFNEYRHVNKNDDDTALDCDNLITNNITCKESDVLVLNRLTFDDSKDWPIDDTASIKQSHDNCLKPDSLIEPAMMHVPQDSIINPTTNYDSSNYTDRLVESNYDNSISNNDNPIANSSMINDNQEALNQGSSVLNFLESLGNDLTCPGTELRNNSIDFSLDLFSFNH